MLYSYHLSPGICGVGDLGSDTRSNQCSVYFSHLGNMDHWIIITSRQMHDMVVYVVVYYFLSTKSKHEKTTQVKVHCINLFQNHKNALCLKYPSFSFIASRI